MQARIGIIANDQWDCYSPDSMIGFGGEYNGGAGCGWAGFTTGDFSGCGSDNGDIQRPMMGYILGSGAPSPPFQPPPPASPPPSSSSSSEAEPPPPSPPEASQCAKDTFVALSDASGSTCLTVADDGSPPLYSPCVPAATSQAFLKLPIENGIPFTFTLKTTTGKCLDAAGTAQPCEYLPNPASRLAYDPDGSLSSYNGCLLTPGCIQQMVSTYQVRAIFSLGAPALTPAFPTTVLLQQLVGL